MVNSVSKKIISAAAVLAVAVSGAALPFAEQAPRVFPVITASAETSGNYEYKLLDDGTAEITKYNGSASKLTLPDTLGGKKVTSVGDRAFESCANLTEVTVPDSITNIGNFAFMNCEALAKVNVSDTIEYIGVSAFEGTAWFNSAKSGSDFVVLGGILIDGKSASGDVTIPDKVRIIGDSAFNSTNITSVTIPGSVKRIGSAAFAYCSALESVTMETGVESIGSYAFYFCTGLTSVTMPESVTAIDKYALSYTGLTELTIPASVTEIDDYAIDTYSGVKLKCYKDTAGHEYAKKFGFEYELITAAVPILTFTVIPVPLKGETVDLSKIECIVRGTSGRTAANPVVGSDGKVSVSGIAAGDYKVVLMLNGYAPRSINVTIGSKPVDLGKIKLCRYGDVDGDGVIGMLDFAKIKRKILGWTEELVYDETADTYLDETLDIRDLALLRQYILGWNVLLGEAAQG